MSHRQHAEGVRPVSVPPPTLTTHVEGERLVLRAPRGTDVPEVRRLLRRNADHLRPWSPIPPPGEDPSSLTAISKAILRHRREWKRGEAFTFFVSSREEGEPIVGRIALTGIIRSVFQNAHVGYWIDFEHQGKGLMSEALALAVSFAFDHAGLHRVQAAIMPRNVASLRVVEKLGFRREGLAERYLQIAGKWEDHALFAVTSDEWKP